MNAAPQAFNLATQQADGWHRRAALAAELLAELLPEGGMVADIGCGDGKLQSALRDRGLAFDWSGFDLLPQSPEVARFDLRSDVLPRRFDAVCLLGVTEYLPDIAAALRALRPCCDVLVASHVCATRQSPSPQRLAALGWVSHLGRGAFAAAVRAGGFEPVRKRMTPDGRTMLVAARRITEVPCTA